MLNYIQQHALPLFRTQVGDETIAEFDSRGFFFSSVAKSSYRQIRDLPHLYVAFNSRSCYVGKSLQNGGRWQRSHSYHLGTLAHELLGTTNQYDQNHNHWIDSWMIRNTLQLGTPLNTVKLQEMVKIVFIPFEKYSNGIEYYLNPSPEDKTRFQKINSLKERELIDLMSKNCRNLLNVQHNR